MVGAVAFLLLSSKMFSMELHTIVISAWTPENSPLVQWIEVGEVTEDAIVRTDTWPLMASIPFSFKLKFGRGSMNILFM